VHGITDVGDVKKDVLLKKEMATHRVSVGDDVVSDSDAAANHAVQRNGSAGIG
jgi:hypothetical protein